MGLVGFVNAFSLNMLSVYYVSEHLLKCFACNNTFNAQNNPMGWVLSFSCLYKWGNCKNNFEKLFDRSPQVTEAKLRAGRGLQGPFSWQLCYSDPMCWLKVLNEWTATQSCHNVQNVFSLILYLKGRRLGKLNSKRGWFPSFTRSKTTFSSSAERALLYLASPWSPHKGERTQSDCVVSSP